MTPPDSAISAAIGHNSLSKVALIHRNGTCKTGLQFAISKIQANRGCQKGAQWSAQKNSGDNNFVGPKMIPPDPAISFNNWT